MYHPRCLQISAVFAVLLTGATTVAAEKPALFQTQLLALHNRARSADKLAPLTHNRLLARAAQAHAAHMAKTGKFAHEGIGDGTIDSRIDDAGYDWKSLGENIAWGGKDAQAAMKVWLGSPPHRAQLLGEHRDVGFGRAVAADGKVYWAACFGVPRSRS